MIRALVVDDEELVRAGLVMILEADPDIEVIAEGQDGAEAVRLARSHQLDVVLMDIRMPRMDGLAATREINRLPGSPKVIVLTTFDLDEYVYQALRAGAMGFLLKDAPRRDLVQAVKVVHAGNAMLAPAVTRRLISKFTHTRSLRAVEAQQRIAGLTERERRVLCLVGEGLANADIASKLHLSEATVKSHVGRLLAKLQCDNRVQAAILAHDAELLAP